MHLDWSPAWLAALRGVLVLFAAILIAQFAHYVLYASLRRARKWRASFSGGAIARHTSAPARLLLILLALSLAIPQFRISAWGATLMHYVLEVSYLAVVAWLITASIEIVHATVVHRLPEDIQDNVVRAASEPRCTFFVELRSGPPSSSHS